MLCLIIKQQLGFTLCVCVCAFHDSTLLQTEAVLKCGLFTPPRYQIDLLMVTLPWYPWVTVSCDLTSSTDSAD